MVLGIKKFLRHPPRRFHALPGERREAVGNLLAHADAAREQRRFVDAADIYADVLVREPDRAAIHVQCGHMNKEARRYELAQKHYRIAETLMPTDPDLQLQLGHFYKVIGHRTAALAAYKQAASLDPEWMEPLAEFATLKRTATTFYGQEASGDLDLDLARLGQIVDADFLRELYGIIVPPNATGSQAKALFRLGRQSEIFYPNRDYMLVLNGIIDTGFLGLFNMSYYRLMNSVGSVGGLAHCLRHFCEHGLDAGLDFSETHRFDQVFYEDVYLGGVSSVDPASLAGFTTRSELLRHWLNYGLPAGWVPNAGIWFRQKTDIDVSDVSVLDLAVYRSRNEDAASMSERNAVEHLLRHGAIEGRQGVSITVENAGIFTQIAERAVSSHPQQAAELFDVIMHHVPQAGYVYHLAADNLLRLGRYREASQLYSTAISLEHGNIWSYLNSADALARLHDLQGSYQTLRAAREVFKADANLMPRRLQEVTEQFFSTTLTESQAMAVNGRIQEAQRRVAELAELLTMTTTEPSAVRRPVRTVAIVSGCDIMQCRLYRVEQKAEHLRVAGFAVKLFHWIDDIEEFSRAIGEFEAVIFYRVLAYPRVISAISRAREFGLLTFYEIDDLLFDARFFPGPYESYAGSITRQQHAELATSVPLYAHAMRLCDYGIASTSSLANEMRSMVRTGSVFVHRNGFGSLHEQCLRAEADERAPKQVTIFYGSGTKAHKQDFQQLVEPALERLVEKHGDKVSILVMGYNPTSGRSEGLTRVITLIPPVWNIEAYWQVLQHADINLAVLAPGLNTACKSEIKWLEAAMLRIPSVVSPTSTYEEVIEQGVDGVLAATADDFYVALDRLVIDSHERRRIGEAAYKSALDRYGVARMARNMRDILGQLSPPRSRKRKVVIVNVFYPPQAVGGGTRVVHDNVRELCNLYGDEYEVEVFTTIVGGVTPYDVITYVSDGIRVTGVVAPNARDLALRPLDPRMEEVFGQYLHRTTPDLVHFHGVQRLSASVVYAARQQGVPYIITVHDGWWVSSHQFFEDENGAFRAYDYTDAMKVLREQGSEAVGRMTALRAALFGARAILAVSERFAEVYHACGVPQARPVPNGLSKLPDAVRTPSKTGRVRLAHVGGMTAAKGYDLVRYAMLRGKYRNLEINVIDLAKSHGDVNHEMWGSTPVTVLPKIAQDKMGEFYSSVDVLLAPSTCTESFGLATREAAAFGCWVIASNRGSIGEPVVNGLNGVVIPVEDLSGLANVLQKIDTDPAKYMKPPQYKPLFRSSKDQVQDLHAIYQAIFNEDNPTSGASFVQTVQDALL